MSLYGCIDKKQNAINKFSLRKDCRKVLSMKKFPIASNRESWTAREYKDFYKSKYIIKSFGLRARSSIRWENSQFFLSNGSV